MIFDKSTFTDLEKQLLEAVAEKLDPQLSALFRGQFSEVNFIQRHGKDKEVNCYVKRFGALRRDPTLRFPVQIEEAKLATVEFRSANSKKTHQAELFTVNGYFFCILFSVNPDALVPPTIIDQVTLDPNCQRN